MTPRVDPTVDYAFKHLFGVAHHFDLTRHLINAVLAPDGHRVIGLEEMNTVGPTQRSGEKVTIYDVRVRDGGKRQFIIEMQRLISRAFIQRELFYLARVHATQHQSGDYHETLQPTVLICFTTGVLYEDDAWHHRFRMHDAGNRVELGKDFEVHTVELSKFRTAADDLKTDLDRWCYFLTRAREMDSDNLPATLNGPEIKKATEVLTRFGLNEAEWQAYLDRDMALRDAAQAEYERTHAKQIGHAEGLDQGVLIGRIQSFQEVTGQPVTPGKELAALSLDALAGLLQTLKQQYQTAQRPTP